MGDVRVINNESVELDWIPAREALGWTVKVLSDAQKAQEEIIRLSAAGLMRARADWAWVYGGPGESNRHDNWLIPAAFWGGASEDTQSLIYCVRPDSWNEGSFTRRMPGDLLDPARRVEANGVEFASADLQTWFPLSMPSPAVHLDPAPDRAKRAGGNPGKVKVWHAFYLEAMTMLVNGDLDELTTQAEMRSKLLARINEGLDDESVKQPVRDIWYKILKKN